MKRFLVRFAAALLGLSFLATLDPVVTHLVQPFNQVLAGWSFAVLDLFSAAVVFQGNALYTVDRGFGVAIEAGCNGVEASLILVSAILAFSGTLLQKLMGIGVGIAAIQAMNVLRIISLFYLGQWSEVTFRWVHLYLWPTLIILDALLVFVLWSRYTAARQA